MIQSNGLIWLNFLILLTLYGLIVIFAEILYKRHIDPFLTRKLAHLYCGVLSASLPLFLDRNMIFLIGFSLILLVLVSKILKVFNGIEVADKLSWGTLYFPLGLIISAAVFLNLNSLIFITAMLVLGIADSTAALIGKNFGKLKYNITGPKTIEGSITFAFCAFIVMCVMYFNISMSFSFLSISLLALGAITTSLIEAVSSKGTDNIFIPLSSGFFLYLAL